MNRRSFAGVLGGLGVLGGAPARAATGEKRTRFYVLQSFKLQAGTQLPRLHEHYSKALPKIDALWSGPKIFLEALIAPHMPQMLTIYGFSSLDEMWSVHGKVPEPPDTGFEPLFEALDTTLVEAAPYSPEITTSRNPKPRVFELRTYHSPTFRQLGALHARFSGPEIKIFHRTGIHPILYSSTLVGQNMPNLTYLIPFDNLAHRESAWNAFAADPEWVRVRKESIEKSGQISIIQNISLWKATDYSPFS